MCLPARKRKTVASIILQNVGRSRAPTAGRNDAIVLVRHLFPKRKQALKKFLLPIGRQLTKLDRDVPDRFPRAHQIC
jgi:hypothetical protein